QWPSNSVHGSFISSRVHASGWARYYSSMGSSSFSHRLNEKIIREACASHARCRRLIADYNHRTPKADAGAEVIAPTRRVALRIEHTARANAVRQRFTVNRCDPKRWRGRAHDECRSGQGGAAYLTQS